jgi:hypothetical protein
MNQNLWMAIGAGVLILAGGIVARLKHDYFSRGMAITLITGVFGIILLLVSPESKARNHREADVHGWPPGAHRALLAQTSLLLILLFCRLI